MLIKSRSERIERRNEKIVKLLNFLKEETYSDLPTLQSLFNYKAHPPMSRLLSSVVDLGLIQKHIFNAPGGKVSLWGITMDGIAMVILPGDTVFPSRFEPSKITGWSMQHHILNQQIRLILEAKGARDWINGDRKNFLTQFDVKHRPDGVITLANGQRIAIETERNLKTKARYQEIMKSHLVAKKAEKWQHVYYVLPDDQKKLALMKLFNSITFLTFSGRPITLEQGHRDAFQFFTISELQTLCF